MFEEVLAFFIGFFSIFSPCVLPILPIVFGISRLKVENAIVLFIGFILSFFILSMVSVLILPFKILAYILLFF
ncbi:MAG: hypothetical protein QXR27_01960 [Archaeoglobaceae archaeon]